MSRIIRKVAAALAMLFALSIASLAHALSPIDAQAELDKISSTFATKAAGIDSKFAENPVEAAEGLYVLAQQSVAVLQATANHPIKRTDIKGKQAQDAALNDARALITRIVRLQEHVQHQAIMMIRKIEPGEPLQKLVTAKDGSDLSKPLFRQEIPDPTAPPPDPEKRYKEIETEFLAEGGKFTSFKNLSKKFLKEAPSNQLMTWVQRKPTKLPGQAGYKPGMVKIIAGDAKHMLFVKGEDAAGAGNAVAIKDNKGKILMMLWSNSSGSYKPGVGSTEGPALRSVKLGVPQAHILTTTAYPLDPGIIKLLARATMKLPKDQLKTFIAGVKQRGTFKYH